MAFFLRLLASVLIVLAILVLVVLPLALGPLLTSVVRDMGVNADALDVSVALFDPTLVFGHSKRVEVDATNVVESPARIGQMTLGAGDVSFFNHTFGSVSAELQDVSIAVGSDHVSVSSISISGPADDAAATARMSAAETASLVSLAARRDGVKYDSVQMTASGLSVTSHGFTGQAQISVHGGALVLDPGVGGPIVLLQPAPSDPFALEEAWMSADGLNVRGTVDLVRLSRQLST